MNLISLEYFITLAEHLNYTKTAKVLYTTQPNISRQIKNLEEELGVELFTRSKTKVTLTPAGQECLATARKIVYYCNELKDTTKQFQSGTRGSLKIGYMKAVAIETMGIFSDIINIGAIDYPNIRIDLVTDKISNLTQALIEGKLDVIFTVPTEIINLPYIEKKSIIQNEVQILVPIHHPLASKEVIHLAELAEEEFVFTRRNVCPYLYDGLIDLCLQYGFSPKITTYCDDQDELPLLVAAGYGITFTGSMLKKENYQNLHFIDIDECDLNTDVFMMWKNNNANHSLQLFIDRVNLLLEHRQLPD